jgi:hypothetical protein
MHLISWTLRSGSEQYFHSKWSCAFILEHTVWVGTVSALKSNILNFTSSNLAIEVFVVIYKST